MLDTLSGSLRLVGCHFSESDDAYPHLRLNDRFRVIVCRDGIQWILQRRDRPGRPERHARSDWRGRSYCRTREALIGCCGAHAGEIGPAAIVVLSALPEQIESPSIWRDEVKPATYPSARKGKSETTGPKNKNIVTSDEIKVPDEVAQGRQTAPAVDRAQVMALMQIECAH
jgi:hypothetical protein